ncbi:uncharacterized protein [Blastocystis hominis]|uniref:Uncharacterized protein n=1 Tax=Blastocystis hominis TaxID=12968 RepID=D8M5V0_BLAHO|nr:uncharacterized protein [Blastocystis hominis]CBK23549.2 unnamed protein product [Blastocystis hominis]|eukprot:XP_012897597.1 uncharacterized protein [Blastocystis hominis]
MIQTRPHAPPHILLHRRRTESRIVQIQQILLHVGGLGFLLLRLRPTLAIPAPAPTSPPPESTVAGCISASKTTPTLRITSLPRPYRSATRPAPVASPPAADFPRTPSLSCSQSPPPPPPTPAEALSPSCCAPR